MLVTEYVTNRFQVNLLRFVRKRRGFAHDGRSQLVSTIAPCNLDREIRFGGIFNRKTSFWAQMDFHDPIAIDRGGRIRIRVPFRGFDKTVTST